MSFQPLIYSGILLGKSGGSMAVGTPITGADPNAILVTDGGSNLQDKVLTNGQVLIGSTGAAPVAATITGTTSQIIVSNSPGSITLSLPQNIATTSVPTFSNLTLTSQLNGPLHTDQNGLIYQDPIDLTSDVTNALPFSHGGTGLAATPTNGQLLIGNGTGYALATVTGTTNQVAVANGAGSITLSLPQSIAPTSSVSFNSLALATPLPQSSGGIGNAGTTAANGQLLIGNGSGLSLGTLTGTTKQVNVSNASGSITLSLPQNIDTTATPTFASVKVTPSGSLDTTATGTLAIGSQNANIINIGNAGATINIQGTTVYENVSTLQVTDPLITLNKGGATGSGSNSGIQIEENAAITAYNETSADRNSWIMKAPGTAGVATVTPGASGITLNQSSHNPVTVALSNGLTVNATQALSLQIANSSVNGALLAADWVTFNNKQTAGNYITQITGDVTAMGPGNVPATLATVNSAPGTTGSASSTSVITTNGKGLVTSNTSTPIQITESQVTNLTADLASKQATGNYLTALTGDGTAAGPGSAALTLATVNSAPGSTGSASSTSVITTNAKGLVTSNTSTPIQITESQVTNLTSDLAAKLTSVSVSSANGLAGTSSGGSTPSLTLSTTVTGVLKGNGTAISAATAGTDYQAPITLTTTGTSGAATFTGNTLNIPNYAPGTGTVTSVSVVSANGFAGTVATPGTTPAITVSTSVTGILKGNGTAVSAAVAGTDYQAPGSYITALTGDATAAGPGTAAITLASVNANVGTFNNVTVNAKGLVTAASTVNYVVTNTGDIAPGSFTGLANNTANQSITGLAFATTVSSFEAFLNIQIIATTNTYTTVKIFGTRKASGTWTGADISAQVTSDVVTGLAFGITSAGVVTVSIGSVAGFTAGTVKYRAISLS